MGGNCNLTCKNCGYSKSIVTGIGMMYSPGSILDFTTKKPFINSLIRSKKEISKIRALIEEKNGELEYSYGHDIYVCENCCELYGRFYLKINYDGGYYEPKYNCTKCRHNLIVFDGFEREMPFSSKNYLLNTLKCPECGEYSIEEGIGDFVLWD